MANLKEIRTRMASVKNTKQVTSAMKMVSAAKLRKAQDAITRIRPYSNKLNEILMSLSQSLGNIEENVYATEHKSNKVLLVVINSNRGLCGAFNANVNKETTRLIKEELSDAEVELMAIGKNAYDFFRKQDYAITEHNSLYDNMCFEEFSPIAESVMQKFVAGEYKKVYLIYNKFKNAATQELTTEQFLPIQQDAEENNAVSDYIYEPSQEQIVEELIPKSLKMQFYKAILESVASEHGARMTSMHKATDNATNLLRELNLQYNKARQTAITNEILEIVSGAEALKG